MKTFVLMYVLAANPVGAADSRPIVNVTGRQLRGTMLDKAGAAFKDIPYAQPPKFSLIKDLCLVVERGNYRNPGVNALPVYCYRRSKSE